MKGTKMTQTRPSRPQVRDMKHMPSDHAQHELLVRRSTNHNVHVITAHGNVRLGRKGRST